MIRSPVYQRLLSLKRKQVIRMTASTAVSMLVFDTSLVPAAFAASGNDFAGGNGTAANPYQIATPQQLFNMETDINSDPSTYENAPYELTADIDMSNSAAVITMVHMTIGHP